MSVGEGVRPGRRGTAAEWAGLAGSFAVFGFLAILYLRPIWSVFGTHLTAPTTDPLFNLYLLKWVAHELPRHLTGFWSAPFYFPDRNIIAHSDHLLGPGLVAAGFTALAPNFVAAMNFLVISSFAFCGLSTCFVLRRCGLGWVAAFAGGCMFAFAPFRWEHVSHVQILQMQWIPLTLWSFDRLLARGTWARAVAFLAFYLLHLSGGTYLAYMIHVPLAALLVSRLTSRLGVVERPTRREWLTWLATGIAAAAAAAVVFVPYWRSGLTWGTEVQRVWGASVLSYLEPSTRNVYSNLWPEALRRPENALFPGWFAAGLAAAGLVSFWRRYGTPPPAAAGRRLALTLLLLVASSGLVLGELHTWSKIQSYSALDANVPGHGYRVPLVLVCVGLAGWMLLRRAWSGWPLRFGEIDPWERGLLLAAVLTVALSHPIVFSKAVHLLPGLRSMRVPTRFQAFTLFSVVWFACRFLDRSLIALRTRAPRAAPWVTAGFLGLLVCELLPRPVDWIRMPAPRDFPAVYAWVAAHPEARVLLELPLQDEAGNTSDLSVSYMYFGTSHWRPLVNGYSAWASRYFAELLKRCCRPTPDDDVLHDLVERGVTHLVVHLRDVPAAQLPILQRWEHSRAADLVYADADTRVYRLPAARAPGPPGNAGR
jgi:hypothetical protein